MTVFAPPHPDDAKLSAMEQGLRQPRSNISYLPHQLAGVTWMLAREQEKLAGGILADDMGLGKTFQTIGLLKNSPHDWRTLIICPPVLLSAWADELRACGITVAVLNGVRFSGRASVYLTTYQKACMYSRALCDIAERIILDEGHIIRNAGTTRARRCMEIAANAKSRWILSATPIQNGAKDWRSLCEWLRFPPKVDASAVMLRRTMSELRGSATLPPPPHFVEHNLTIPPDSDESRLFQVLGNNLENAMDGPAQMRLAMWMRIQQFMVHPQIYIDGMRARVGTSRPDWPASETTTKWTEFSGILRTCIAEKQPTIVFCNFRAEMDLVESYALAAGAAVFSVRGGTDAGAAVKDSKQAWIDGRPVVVVIQIVSGGAGLNLQFCTRILFLSQHWNPAVVHQAVGRAVRIGQPATVDIHIFRIVDKVMDNIDLRMLGLHRTKVGVARGICESFYEGFHESVLPDAEKVDISLPPPADVVCKDAPK
jgi:SNF2 family DNA or RNA helicase